MGKVTRRLSIEELVFYTQPVEKFRQDDTADRIDGVYDDTESALADSFKVEQLEVHHLFNMPSVKRIIVRIAA